MSAPLCIRDSPAPRNIILLPGALGLEEERGGGDGGGLFMCVCVCVGEAGVSLT